ncbi:metallophosphoesterase [Candidatus Woesearchaeota archaeon]|nr:metallophosphoesterase [Candidatus Woesearchaeota archaeon]
MKFLIIGDLHGRMPRIRFKGFDAIIAPGDFCSDALRTHMFRAMRRNMEHPDRPAVQWYNLIGKRRARKMVLKSLADGRRILEFLDSFGVPVYTVPGNWDWTGGSAWKFLDRNHWKGLKRGLRNIIDVYHRRVSVEGFDFIGHGITSGPELPVHHLKEMTSAERKRARHAYERLRRPVARLFRTRTPVIFLSHNVPYGTPIDRITDKNSPRCGMHFGSYLARDMVETHHPIVCIGGHMHEHFRACKLGKTTCINAGFGSDVNVWLELDGRRIKRLKFYRRR